MPVHVVGNLEVNHGGAMLEAVVARQGIARLPDFLVADALRAGRLLRLLTDFDLPPSGIHLVYPTATTPLPKLKVFVDEIGALLKARVSAVRSAAT
jgi:DNA-binding transcriptional LysR family regulator